MNLAMYSDSEKNIVMFLPDDFSDEEIMALGEVSVPDEMFFDDYSVFPAVLLKPTSCINLYNTHATYPIDTVFPDVFPPFV